MKLLLDLKSGLPIYLQIVQQIKHKIAAGELGVGEKLPTVRQLATDLEINPNTVVKAYTELERTEIIESKQGVGTFIKKEKDVVTNNERSKKLLELTQKYVNEAIWLGFNDKEIIESVKLELENPKKE